MADSSLIPTELGITNTCQHFDRFLGHTYHGHRPHRLSHSSNANQTETEEDNEPLDMETFTQIGTLHHRFGFRSVYDPNRRPPYVSTRQNGYVMVDYIFYSTYFSTQFSKYIEGNLKLLGRLHLYNAEDCQKMGHLPNSTCPSDHLALVSKF